MRRLAFSNFNGKGSRMSETILAIDPGLNVTGYAALKSEGNSLKILEAGILKSKKSNTMSFPA